MQILSLPASRTGPTSQIARTTSRGVTPTCGAIALGHLAGEFFTRFLRFALLPLVAKLELVRMIGFQTARASVARCLGARGAGTLWAAKNRIVSASRAQFLRPAPSSAPGLQATSPQPIWGSW